MIHRGYILASSPGKTMFCHLGRNEKDVKSRQGKIKGPGSRAKPSPEHPLDGLLQDKEEVVQLAPTETGKCCDYLWPKVSPDLPM